MVVNLLVMIIYRNILTMIFSSNLVICNVISCYHNLIIIFGNFSLAASLPRFETGDLLSSNPYIWPSEASSDAVGHKQVCLRQPRLVVWR